VPFVVCDTSVLLPAWFSPKGRRRKLLVVFAYGALAYYAQVGAEELDLLHRQEGAVGLRTGGPPIDELVAKAAARKARLEEFMPTAPDDFVLAGSRILFGEFEDKATELGPRLAVDVSGEIGSMARLGVQALTGVIVPDFSPQDVRTHTTDRHDDMVVETALRAGAEIIVSDDRRHLSLTSNDTTLYRGLGGSCTEAYQLDLFVERHLSGLHFSLDDVDPTLLPMALED
jgi:predicted nucleic acid-binding protein